MTGNYRLDTTLKLRNILPFIIAPMLGFLSITLPPYLSPGKTIVYYDASLFPIIATAIKNLSILPTAILLFLTGLIVGYLKPKMWWVLGFSTIILFPIAAILEMIVQPTSHNLWPFEFLLYAGLSVPAMIGALITANLKKKTNQGD